MPVILRHIEQKRFEEKIHQLILVGKGSLLLLPQKQKCLVKERICAALEHDGDDVVGEIGQLEILKDGTPDFYGQADAVFPRVQFVRYHGTYEGDAAFLLNKFAAVYNMAACSLEYTDKFRKVMGMTGMEIYRGSFSTVRFIPSGKKSLFRKLFL